MIFGLAKMGLKLGYQAGKTGIKTLAGRGMMGKALYGIGKGAYKGIGAVFGRGPGATALWGAGQLLPGQFRALKFAVPIAGLGALGIMNAQRKLLNAPYSIDSPRVGRLGADYTVAPPSAPMMEFGSFRRSNLDMNATGSLSFALHNRR